MSKKITTLLLLAVFVVAQFSVASAARLATGDATLSTAAVFSGIAAGTTLDLDWTATGLPAGTKSITIWSRIQDLATPVAYTSCQAVATILGTSDASGTFAYDMTTVAPAPANADVVEFIAVLDDAAGCAAVAPIDTDDAMASVTIDSDLLTGFIAVPPTTGPVTMSCNTFEYWAIASDNYNFAPTEGYSGFGAWNQVTAGTFAPAPEGPASELLAWGYTFPATAVVGSNWSFSIQPEDAAGNQLAAPLYFRNAVALAAGETADCADFPDTAGHANELYVRYLADLGLISGFADGTFGPDSTLTRAEAAALFEKANGRKDTDAGFDTAPVAGSACDFSDVAATDWFAGWVWRACEDGFMNGVGGGMFDPNNTLTRGQVVTIINNVDNAPLLASYLNTGNVLNGPWGAPVQYRTAAFTDVFVGAYYAQPVVYAYGTGVADGMTDTTFGPDEPATRADFSKMLYRALSLPTGY